MVHSTGLDKANALIKFFTSTFTIDDGYLPQLQDSHPGSELHSIGFMPGSVLRAMKGMKASKALNPDGIPSFILKEVRDELCEPLAILFQISFEQCKFPTSWKLSHVPPIFKGKGKRSDPENYRPISLTSPFLKIMERVIVEKLNSHLELNNLISDHQHGFRKNCYTVSQLVVIHDYIQSTFDRGIPIDNYPNRST